MNSLASFSRKVKTDGPRCFFWDYWRHVSDGPTRFFWDYWRHVSEAIGKNERWDLFFLGEETLWRE